MTTIVLNKVKSIEIYDKKVTDRYKYREETKDVYGSTFFGITKKLLVKGLESGFYCSCGASKYKETVTSLHEKGYIVEDKNVYKKPKVIIRIGYDLAYFKEFDTFEETEEFYDIVISMLSSPDLYDVFEF